MSMFGKNTLVMEHYSQVRVCLINIEELLNWTSNIDLLACADTFEPDRESGLSNRAIERPLDARESAEPLVYY